MARGRDRHAARKSALQALGKDLSRRARSKCELCGDSGALTPVEPAPVPDDPHVDLAFLACERCRGAIDGRLPDSNDLRFLETAIWAELAIVQIAAVRLLERLVADAVPWATVASEGLWLDDAMRARVDAT